MSVQFRDYYAVLGVPRDASHEDVRRAFRKLARQFHPDVAKDKRTAESKFKDINEAYEVLGDPEKRRKYDALGQSWDQMPQAEPRGRRSAEFDPDDLRFSGTGFSDFFEQFFGGESGFEPFRGSSADVRRGGRVPRHTKDIEGDILVLLDEVLRGGVRTVTVEQPGHGGAGSRSHQFQVRIPLGVAEGQKLRIPGRGARGGMGHGDIYLRVRLEKHPVFAVDGRDLRQEIELAPWEAVLGGHVEVPTLDGAVQVRIAPATPPGRVLRLRGRGLPDKSGHRGDLFVTLRLEIPDSLTSRERELWEQLARESDFRPRS